MADDLGLTILPQNREAEQAVIGSIISSPDKVILVDGIIDTEDFFYPRNKEIYSAILELNRKGVPADIITLCDELNRRESLERCGGELYLEESRSKAINPDNIEHYARIVSKQSVLRKLIAVGQRITNIAYEAGDDAIERAEAEVFEISKAIKEGRDFVTLYNIAEEYLLAADQGITANSVRTGLLDLDDLIGGFKKSDLIVIAARTSMGKSALALTIARNIGILQSYGEAGVGIFSLEMSKEQICHRFLSMESGVDSRSISEYRLTMDAKNKVAKAIASFYEAPIYIDYSGYLGAAELRSKARRMVMEHPEIKAIIVDYLQLVHGSKKNASETETVTEVSRTLKTIAMELNMPVIALAQLNRDVESRNPPVPMLSDLRSSGAIEQDADQVLFIYREDKYDEDSDRKNIADIIVAKNRNGPTGKISLYFQEETTRFHNLDRVDKD